ncbi:MAG: T9SS type A sorting domain-containing protein [Fibrobacter sp.]|nr:T9SS type A sorting domain-containing protein [Fibrobacter sp.]
MKKKQVNVMMFMFILIFLNITAYAQWQQTNWTTSNNYFRLHTSQNRVFARSWDSLNGGRMFYSSDSGSNWNLIGAADSGTVILSVLMFNNIIHAGTWNGFYRSTSDGASWVAAAMQGIPVESSIWAVAMFNSILYAGVSGTVYKSSDSGTTWIEINSGLPANTRITSFVTNGNTIFASSDINGIFMLENDQSHWTAISFNLPDKHIFQMAVSGDKLVALNSKGIFISADNGATWKNHNSTLGNVNCILSVKKDLLAGTDTNGVYISSDGGMTWVPYNQGLPAGTRVLSLAATNGNLYAGTNSGIWRIPFSTSRAIITGTTHTAISHLELVRQTKTSATIRLSLPNPGTVDIALYNMSGKLVLPVVCNMFVTGLQSYTFDTRAVAPGTYILRITTGSSAVQQTIRIKR